MDHWKENISYLVDVEHIGDSAEEVYHLRLCLFFLFYVVPYSIFETNLL